MVCELEVSTAVVAAPELRFGERLLHDCVAKGGEVKAERNREVPFAADRRVDLESTMSNAFLSKEGNW